MVKVSIMIIGYNAEKYIEEAIDSALEQTYADFEVVFVDDGSTDRTAEIVKSYKDRVRYFYQTNQGISKARNNGLKNSRGEYVALLDGDDCFLPHKLEKQVAIMDSHHELSFTCSETWVMDESSQTYTKWKRHDRQATFEGIYQRNMIWVPTVMIRRRWLEEIGGWDERLPISQDYDLWLRLAKKAPFYFLDEPLTRYRNRLGSMGKRTWLRLQDHKLILNKREISGDKSFLEKRIRQAQMYCYFAQIFLEEKNERKAGVCYANAVLSYPFIGAFFWPLETRGRRFTWPYRVLKIYYFAIYYWAKSFFEPHSSKKGDKV